MLGGPTNGTRADKAYQLGRSLRRQNFSISVNPYNLFSDRVFYSSKGYPVLLLLAGCLRHGWTKQDVELAAEMS